MRKPLYCAECGRGRPLHWLLVEGGPRHVCVECMRRLTHADDYHRMQARRERSKGQAAELVLLILLTAAVILLVMAFSGRRAPMTAKPDTEVEAKLDQVMRAQGDLTSAVYQMTETVTQIDQRTSEMGDVLGDVQGDMIRYGTSPEDAELEESKSQRSAVRNGGLLAIALGMLLLGLFLPSVGGPVMLIAALVAAGAGVVALVFGPMFL